MSDTGLVRSGFAMATGTLASRISGFLRTVVIAAALGNFLADSYNVANTIPNILYDLLLGGVLSSIVIPLLVHASQRGEEEGTAYAQRLFTIVAATLAVVSVVGVLLAPQIVDLYAGRLSGHDHELATTFARYFLPQVLFYGLGAVIGAILNTRGSFAAPMWAPVLNNCVVIASGGLFLAITTSTPDRRIPHTQRDCSSSRSAPPRGIVVQTIALLPALRARALPGPVAMGLARRGFRSAGPFAGMDGRLRR